MWRENEEFGGLGEQRRAAAWGNTRDPRTEATCARDQTRQLAGAWDISKISEGGGWRRGGAAGEDARQDAGLAPTMEGIETNDCTIKGRFDCEHQSARDGRSEQEESRETNRVCERVDAACMTGYEYLW